MLKHRLKQEGKEKEFLKLGSFIGFPSFWQKIFSNYDLFWLYAAVPLPHKIHKIMHKKNTTNPKKRIPLPAIAKMTVIECVAQIIDLAENSKLEKSFFSKALPYSQKVALHLGIDTRQAVIFSLFMNEFHSTSIDVKEIAEFVDYRPIHLLKYMQDIAVLEEKKLLIVINVNYREYNTLEYKIPKAVVEALKKNEPIVHKSYSNISVQALFDVFDDFFENTCIELGTKSYVNGFSEIQGVLQNNLHLPFVKMIIDYELRKIDLMLFLYFCHALVNNGDNEIRIRDFENMFDRNTLRTTKRNFEDQSHVLFQQKLIENGNSNTFLERDLYTLTEKAKTNFLSEFKLKKEKKKIETQMKLYQDIIEKPLFYNEKETAQIATLKQLIDPQQFLEIKNRMQQSGLRTGFSILLYGYPGTGKTETVLQLAKLTKRHIFWVDISQTKSMWFGESEKQIKAIFDNYKTIAEKEESTPIFLFNEADAIFGKRNSSTERSVDQTQNAIQNIILQEMETLQGILIATTNLTANLDKAFERRFLYKIQFEKPLSDAKQKIWQSMMPNLSENECFSLAKQYDFTGGEIENIIRKQTIETIISGDEIGFEKLQKICDEEKILTHTYTQKIGFQIS